MDTKSSLFLQIKEKSAEIDWTNKDISEPLSISFPVPENHTRYLKIKNYSLFLTQFSKYHSLETDLIICDEGVREYLKKDLGASKNIVFVNPNEAQLKNIDTANEFFEAHKNDGCFRILAIGGGIVVNFSSYVAKKMNVDLVYIPTTIIPMSDGSIGGKVRLNDVKEGRYIKHAYKEFYEPSQIILDPQFLEYLNDEQIRIGLAEIIKHAVYQSPLLAKYLLSDNFQPFKDRVSLLRAILWTADLKRICLEVDPEESKDGSYIILRAAHDISDKIEERSKFEISHGRAVESAMVEDLYPNKEKYELLISIYQKIGIGYTTIFS